MLRINRVKKTEQRNNSGKLIDITKTYEFFQKRHHVLIQD